MLHTRRNWLIVFSHLLRTNDAKVCMSVSVYSFFTARHKRLHSQSEIDMCEIKRRVNFIGFYIEMCYAFAFSFHVFRLDRVRFTLYILSYSISGCRAIILDLFDLAWLSLAEVQRLHAETEIESREKE